MIEYLLDEFAQSSIQSNETNFEGSNLTSTQWMINFFKKQVEIQSLQMESMMESQRCMQHRTEESPH